MFKVRKQRDSSVMVMDNANPETARCGYKRPRMKMGVVWCGESRTVANDQSSVQSVDIEGSAEVMSKEVNRQEQKEHSQFVKY